VGSGLLSPWHLAILALVLLLIFGPKRLPEMGRSLGHGLREFKDSVSGLSESHHDGTVALPSAEGGDASGAVQAAAAPVREHDTV
jgi:sec-independent protein translocase protein TatA